MREMKDSGVEWIGKIPKDWEIVPLTKQLDSIVDYRGKTPEKTEEGTFLVTAKNIKDGKICYELSKEYVREADYEEIMHRGIPQIGDILFTTEAPLGQVANVDRTDIALAQRIIKFRALSTVNNYYLKYWMLNEGFQQFLHSLSTGSTATGIKSSKLFLLPLVRPNIEQQNKIVEYLDAKCFVLNDKNGMCPKYYLYMMQMCYSARIFYGLGQGVSGMGRWRLQADKFLNFYIPIPPYDEQKKIADYITDKVNHIEVEIDKRNKLIKKYQEYKKSLIYEVVTGKKEV